MKYKVLHNAWLWFAVFCVAVFFITQLVLSWCVSWATATDCAVAQEQVKMSGTVVPYSVETIQRCDLYGFVAHIEPAQGVLILETENLPAGLVRVQ